MSRDANGRDAVDAYLLEALDGAGRACVRRALDLVDRGVPIDGVIVDLLGAAQREAGERWLRNEWSVADEHLTSGATQKALDAVANTVDQPPTEGLVVVACAEGDWHSLPAQMFADMLGARGFAVTFLGASTPVDHVAALLSRHLPDALAVSCNLPIFFNGVTRLADVAHRQGIPVIAGGRALGVDPDRALRLGADAWAATVDDAVVVLHGWLRGRPDVSPEPSVLVPELLLLDLQASEIAEVAFRSLSDAYPSMASYDDEQLARTREDLAFITRFTAAACLVEDLTVLTDMLDWLRTLLAARGVPPAAVAAGLSVLAPLIQRASAQAGQYVLDAS